MNFGEKDVKKISTILLVALLLFAIFFLIRPILLPIIGGLILAYVFMPLYKKLNLYIKNKTLCASIISFLIVVGTLFLLWILIPIISQQIFKFFSNSQTIDVQKIIKTIFSQASDQFITQITLTINSFISKASSAALNSLVDILLDLPKILINFFIVAIVFFFTLRDADKLKEFVKGLSPLNDEKEKVIVTHFKGMTDSVIYGHVIVGIIQGLLAGIGFFIFGVKNPIVLSLLAIFFSILPFVGPFIIWIPVTIYLFSTRSQNVALLYLLYNVFIVSLIDNVLRSYIISKRTKVSTPVVLVGMIGGVFVFGILGLIIGPLLLAYFITLLESFKDKSIYTLFSDSK